MTYERYKAMKRQDNMAMNDINATYDIFCTQGLTYILTSKI